MLSSIPWLKDGHKTILSIFNIGTYSLAMLRGDTKHFDPSKGAVILSGLWWMGGGCKKSQTHGFLML